MATLTIDGVDIGELEDGPMLYSLKAMAAEAKGRVGDFTVETATDRKPLNLGLDMCTDRITVSFRVEFTRLYTKEVQR